MQISFIIVILQVSRVVYKHHCKDGRGLSNGFLRVCLVGEGGWYCFNILDVEFHLIRCAILAVIWLYFPERISGKVTMNKIKQCCVMEVVQVRCLWLYSL